MRGIERKEEDPPRFLLAYPTCLTILVLLEEGEELLGSLKEPIVKRLKEEDLCCSSIPPPGGDSVVIRAPYAVFFLTAPNGSSN